MLRVAFFGQTGPYAPAAFAELIKPGAEFEIALVIEGRRLPSEGRDHVMVPAGAVTTPTEEVLCELASAAWLNTLVTCDVNSPQAIEVIRSAKPDVIACVGFDRLFKPALLEVAPLGGINSHPSPLPKWRGPAPIFWAAKAGLRSLSLSLHALDAREDHGVIYCQEPFVWPRRATTDDVYRIAGSLAGQLLRSHLPQAGQLVGRVQDDSLATRAPRPEPEDAFFDASDWEGEHLLDFVNIAPFHRAAWTRLGEDVFFVRAGMGFEAGKSIPGQYLQQGAVMYLQCKDGVVELEVQV